MNISTIKTKIGRRVGDPNLDTYSGVVQDYFEQAFTMLISKREEGSLFPVYEDQITPLIEYKDITVQIKGGIGDYSLANIENLNYAFTVITNYDKIISYKYISSNEVVDMYKNPNLFPTQDEGFWSKVGKKIRILTGSTRNPTNLQIGIVKNPATSDWKDSTDLSSYGLGFLYDCISLASDLLMKQQRIEG